MPAYEVVETIGLFQRPLNLMPLCSPMPKCDRQNQTLADKGKKNLHLLSVEKGRMSMVGVASIILEEIIHAEPLVKACIRKV